MNTSEGKVVRAFHRFTLVDQTGGCGSCCCGGGGGGGGSYVLYTQAYFTTRDAGTAKISCVQTYYQPK